MCSVQFIYFCFFFLSFFHFVTFCQLCSFKNTDSVVNVNFGNVEQGYKSLLRRELQAEFERRQLADSFFDQNRDKIFVDKKVVDVVEPVEQNRASLELNEAVPPTETLNVEAQKARAELARQGSLADRNPPASLTQVRAKPPPQLAFDADVTYDDGAPVVDESSPVSPLFYQDL